MLKWNNDKSKLSLNQNPSTSIEILLYDLQQKIRVMFDSEYSAFRFFDLLQTKKISKDQFLFGINFL